MKIKQMKLREMGDQTKRFNIVPRIYLRRKKMREGNIPGDNSLNFLELKKDFKPQIQGA